MVFRKFKEKFQTLLRLEDSTHKLTLSFSIGVFIAFSPLLGFHLVMVLFVGWFFRLNMVALFLGAVINNPWTILPIMGVSTWSGTLLFRQSEFEGFSSLQLSDLSLWAFFGQLEPLIIPFFLGSTVLGLIAGFIAYPIVFFLIQRYRERKELQRG